MRQSLVVLHHVQLSEAQIELGLHRRHDLFILVTRCHALIPVCVAWVRLLGWALVVGVDLRLALAADARGMALAFPCGEWVLVVDNSSPFD